MKILPERLKSRFELEEERICELEGSSRNRSEGQREKMNSEYRLRDLGDTIKHSNIHITEGKRKGKEYLKKIMAENSLIFVGNINLHSSKNSTNFK